MERKIMFSINEAEKMRKNSMEQILMNDEYIIQDNADLLELEKKYNELQISWRIRRIINDYIACLLAREERMEFLIYYAGCRDTKIYYNRKRLK